MSEHRGWRARGWAAALLVAAGATVGLLAAGLLALAAYPGPDFPVGEAPPIPESQDARVGLALVVIPIAGALLAVALLREAGWRRVTGLIVGGVAGYLLAWSWAIQERAYPVAEGARFTESRIEYSAVAVDALRSVVGAEVEPRVVWNIWDDGSFGSHCETSHGGDTDSTRLYLEVSVVGGVPSLHDERLLDELARSDLHPPAADHDSYRDVSVHIGRRSGETGSETVIYITTPCLRDP